MQHSAVGFKLYWQRAFYHTGQEIRSNSQSVHLPCQYGVGTCDVKYMLAFNWERRVPEVHVTAATEQL